jgi:alpha-L-fucosidase 2
MDFMARIGRALLSLLILPMAATSVLYAAPRQNIEYSRVGDVILRLDAHIPEGEGPFPAVILVHGGGWVGGDRERSVRPLFQPIADAGLACFSISYRLATDFLRFGAAVEDVRQAVQFVRAHAAEYNVDPKRIALVGESAGAHLASLAAMEDPKSITAVVALYSPSDLETLALTSNMIPANIRQLAEASGLRPLLLARLRELSPIQHIAAGLPPFLLIHGTDDTLVPFDQSLKFQEKLRAAGVSCELLPVKGGGHGIRGWEYSPNLRAYKSAMISWLRQQLMPAP